MIMSEQASSYGSKSYGNGHGHINVTVLLLYIMKVVCTFRYDVMVIVIRHLLIIHNPFFRLPCLLTMPISLSLFINFSTPR